MAISDKVPVKLALGVKQRGGGGTVMTTVTTQESTSVHIIYCCLSSPAINTSQLLAGYTVTVSDEKMRLPHGSTIMLHTVPLSHPESMRCNS